MKGIVWKRNDKCPQENGQDETVNCQQAREVYYYLCCYSVCMMQKRICTLYGTMNPSCVLNLHEILWTETTSTPVRCTDRKPALWRKQKRYAPRIYVWRRLGLLEPCHKFYALLYKAIPDIVDSS
jgi:hypothetical protein